MDGSRTTRRMAATHGIARRLHAVRISAQQRLHLAALLIALAALPLRAADISFTDTITPEEFQKFSRIVGQAIFATPVQPARATGLLGFGVGIAANVVNIDTNASDWLHSVSSNNNLLVHGNYVGVPRLVVSKGFGAGTISGMYAKVSNSDIKTYGGALDVPILRGSVVIPEVAFRGSYSTLSGEDVFKERVYGAEVFVSKGFGPLTPYGAVGRMRPDAHLAFLRRE